MGLDSIRKDVKLRLENIHIKESVYEKISHGPMAALLSKGPLKRFKPKKEATEVGGAATGGAASIIKEVDYDYHKLTNEELNNVFATSCSNGMSDAQAKELLLKNGPNILQPPESHLIRKWIGYLTGGFCWILWVGVIICFLAWQPIGSPPDPTNLGLAILLIIVILLQAAFEAFQDFSSNKIMKSIKNLMAAEATVMRNGVEIKVPASEIVVGDLVVLTYGQKVPADLRIIESHDLRFDRSMLTGESEAIEGLATCTDENYTESKNIAFMATMITNGTGKAIVTLTGSQTMIGSIAVLTANSKKESTTLQKEIHHFVRLIAVLSITTVSICFIVWGAWIYQSYPGFITVSSMLVNAIAILVAFIPTGLPVSLTLSLLLMAKRMARNKVLVKNLTVIETLSCVNVIASDKTGTLTQNKMFVVNAAAGQTLLTSDMARRASVVDTKVTNQFNSAVQFIHTCLLCNEAKFEDSQQDKPPNERAASGGATDIAILKYGANLIEPEAVTNKYTVLSGIPFNSRNKWMASVFRPNANMSAEDQCFELADDECVLTLKGAPDILIKRCKWVIQKDGTQTLLNADELQMLQNTQTKWCEQGQRVLLMCKRTCKTAEMTFEHTSELEAHLRTLDDLCVLGIVGIIDKPREGIDQVIRTCRTAGVRIFMVTGDFSVTAAAIAQQIGIFTTREYDTITELRQKDIEQLKKKETAIHEEVKKSKRRPSVFVSNNDCRALLLTGTDLETLEDEYWRVITRYEEIVFARTTPSQKLRVVEEFKKDKNIVAVTGDGVNDSPALKAANIGIAMGGGSEVAMEAAQVVLLDNNFNSMVIAIENGRLVFDNLRKVILYLLPAGSFAEVVPIILNIYLGVPPPLSAFQMICICILTDMGPSLAMMIEKSEGDLLQRPPRVIGKNRLVDKKLLLFAYFFLGVFESFFSILMYFLYLYMYGNFAPSEIFLAYNKWTDGYLGRSQATLDRLNFTGQTVTFATLVIIQTFGNVYITRTRVMSLFRSLPFLKAHRNLWMFVGQASSIILMIVIIYVPFFNNVFHTQPIPVEFYFIPLIFCFIFIGFDELRKLLIRRKVSLFVDTAW